MTLRALLWILALWAPILGIAWYYKGTYRPPQPDAQINERIAKLRADGIRQCVEAVEKQLPDYARERAAELKAECLKR